MEDIGKRVVGINARTDIFEEDKKRLKWSVNSVGVQQEKNIHHLISLSSKSSQTA